MLVIRELESTKQSAIPDNQLMLIESYKASLETLSRTLSSENWLWEMHDIAEAYLKGIINSESAQ